MKKLIALFFVGFISSVVAADGLMVMNPWIAEAPPTAKMNAAYMEIMNHSGKTVTLTGVTSKQLGHIMMHNTVVEDGVAKMVHLSEVVIEQNQSVKFAPGGMHLMFSAPEKALKAGDKVEMTLHFADGTEKTVSFVVRKHDEGMGMNMNMGGEHNH